MTQFSALESDQSKLGIGLSDLCCPWNPKLYIHVKGCHLELPTQISDLVIFTHFT